MLQKGHDLAPVQGWDQWSQDIMEIVRLCESMEALDRVQDTNRALLRAIQREWCGLYEAISVEVANRRLALSQTTFAGS